MSSRALSLAAVLLLIGSFAPKPALAQENLDAGKTPSQLFAGTCSVCHKSPRGLLKTVPPSSLPSFLRQHYTTSPNMAGALASYLVSNGASDSRIGGDGPKGAKGAKEGAKEGAKQQEAKQEARPEPRQGQSEQLDRWGRRVHPQEANVPVAEPRPEPRPEGAEQITTDRGPDGRKNAKQKLTKRGRPGEALPKEEPAAAVEPPKTESRPDETAGRDDAKPDTAKPAEDDRSQSAKVEQPPELRMLRPDPVPPVTPAPPTAAAPSAAPAASPSAPSSTPAPVPVQAAAQAPVTEMAVPLPASPTPPAPPPVAASAPPQPPMPPAGPPAPPISQ